MLLIILTIYNIIVFIIYGIDKFIAGTGHRRVSEKILLFLAFFGGSPGALLGMKLFRHKTRKISFQFWLILILLVQGVLGVLIYYYLY